MIKALIVLALSFLILSPTPASAKTPYDNDIKNEIPLIGTITKGNKIYNKSYSTPSFLQDLYISSSIEPLVKAFKAESLDYDNGARWAIMSYRNRSDHRVPFYIFGNKDIKMRIGRIFHNNNFLTRWAFCNDGSTRSQLRIYTFETGYTSSSFDGFTYLRSDGGSIAPGECTFIHSKGGDYRSYINNFNIQYPEGYEGDRFYAELPTEPDKIKTSWRYGLARNKLWVKVYQPQQLSKAQFNQMSYNVDLFKTSGDDEIMLKSMTLSVADTFEYNFDDQHEHTTYYIAVKLIKGDVDVPYAFEEVTRWFDYTGDDTVVSGSSGDFVAPDVDTSKYKYEQCEALDIACHLRNVFTKITELFAGFFVPDATILSDDFNRFVTFFKSKLGFLWQSVDLVINSLDAMLSPPASCSFSVSGTGGGLVGRFEFNLCTLQSRFPTLFDFGFLMLRGSIAFALVFAINNKLRGVLQS